MMNKRDLLADLKFCDRATQGPWRHEWNPDYSEVYAPGVDNPIILVGHDPYDADFIVQAREGWPHAIERAMQAEQKLAGLQAWEEPKVKSYLHTMQRIAELESLARKLVYSLKLIRGSSQFSHTTWEEITDLANIALIGAEEVLDDEV